MFFAFTTFCEIKMISPNRTPKLGRYRYQVPNLTLHSTYFQICCKVLCMMMTVARSVHGRVSARVVDLAGAGGHRPPARLRLRGLHLLPLLLPLRLLLCHSR